MKRISQKIKRVLLEAGTRARHHDFEAMDTLLRGLLSKYQHNVDVMVDVANLYATQGFLSMANSLYEKANAVEPNNPIVMGNYVDHLRETGDQQKALDMYYKLLVQFPDHPQIRHNWILNIQYSPLVSDDYRLKQAQLWGEWAIARAGGEHERPPMHPLINRPFRVGYISGDFFQHTVGLLVKDVIQHHSCEVYAYGTNSIHDWVTKHIAANAHYRDVSKGNLTDLAAIIRRDNLDILVDLSGHTGDTRLTMFPLRPAPVLISWLGYFSTTGLRYMDAVILDKYLATKNEFIEPIINLKHGRFCYSPVPFAPEVCTERPNRPITFGSFNNTAKYNDDVFSLWAKILHAVPDSRLILKWRTFNDAEMRKSITQVFADLGIAAERIDLRGASTHKDMLAQYADMDIALDPFPFSGCQTSCEALWMGVPVVTMPRNRMVSRQTHAILHHIGLPEFSAGNEEEYVTIATDLASDPERLHTLRTTLRDKMRASPLMDVEGFTRELENTYVKLYNTVMLQQNQKFDNNVLLHVGPGHRNNGAYFPPAFKTWKEVRLDIDPACEPDIIGTILDMKAVPDASVDAVYSSHNIEHVHTHEVQQVLKEFLRVLRPGGFALITCPDLQTVCQLVAEDKLCDTAYMSGAGPIRPIDILFGHAGYIAQGNEYMHHKTGFTKTSLIANLREAGFAAVGAVRRPAVFDLWAIASKDDIKEASLRKLAATYIPN